MDLSKIAERIAADSSLETEVSGVVRTAGVIEFKRDTGPLRREIRAPGFQWSSDSLKTLAKVLWSAQRAHSYSISAFRLFSKLPSSSLSPDGLLGGRGYIQNIKDMRTNLAAAVEAMSSFNDTVQDEINADHWRAPEEPVDPETIEVMEDVAEIRQDPDAFVEDEYETDIEEELEGANPAAEELNPAAPDPEPAMTPFEQQSHGDQMASGFTLPSVINPKRAFRASSGLPDGLTPAPDATERGPGAGNDAGNFNPVSEMWPSDDPTGNKTFPGTNETVPLYDYSGFPQTPVDSTKGDRSKLRQSFDYSGE